jgi:osmotically-inducible protein OsmY
MPESAKLTHAVEKALAADERTAGLEHHVHVKAVGAAVFLDGEVESDEMRDLVIELVKKVEGVGLVRDRLQINPQARGGGWREEHAHGGE